MINPSIFIIGAGPGIALRVAQLFASHGFSVGLASRSKEHLTQLTARLPPNTTSAISLTDASDPQSVLSALDELEGALGKPSVVVYNADSLPMPKTPVMEMGVAEMQTHMVTNAVSGFAAAKWAATHLVGAKSGHPSMIFTGGSYALLPPSTYAGLAAGKAALLSISNPLRWRTEQSIMQL